MGQHFRDPFFKQLQTGLSAKVTVNKDMAKNGYLWEPHQVMDMGTRTDGPKPSAQKPLREVYRK